MTDPVERVWQLLDLVSREDQQLAGVTARLFATATGDLAVEWLTSLLGTPEGIDRLESFVGKFSRMQDTIVDKLLPALLVATGERRGTALDNLNLAHKLGFVSHPDAWLGMRLLRNRLVHEYVEDLADLAAALQKGSRFDGRAEGGLRSGSGLRRRPSASSARALDPGDRPPPPARFTDPAHPRRGG
ncbi:MAG: nucleotidyltransferase substrate binding protein [Chromatiaceae bacterium]|jgi:hypothetical protein|nr:nucleotidyltransferase substrate binding protein [Chromatiaceae bacterium]